MIAALPLVVIVMALALPIAITLAIVLYIRRRRSAAATIADRHLLGRLSEADLSSLPIARVVMVLFAAIAIAATLALSYRASDPLATEAPSEVVLLLDASGSMLVEDAQSASGMVTRLEAERSAAREIVSSLGGQALGLGVFAGDAFILSPQTYDYAALQLYLDALHPSVVSQTGSSLASGIRQGTALLTSSGEQTGGALVLVSDGDALEPRDSVLAAARLAGELGIRIHTLGIGDANGAAVPDIDYQTGIQMGFKHEPDGSVAISSLNERLLREISAASGGEYFPQAQQGSINGLLSQLDAADPFNSNGDGDWPWLAKWLLVGALLLLAAESLTSIRALRRTTILALSAILAASGCNRQDPVKSAEAAFENGDYAAAAAKYAQTAEGDRRSLALGYNLGTALLWAGRFEEARPHLKQATQTDRAAIAWRAHYNNGNTDLVPVFRGGAGEAGRERLTRAVAAYRNSLRINSDDPDAKWNLELAMRLLEGAERGPDPDDPEKSGDGGGGGGGGTGGADQPRPASPSQPQGRLSRAEATRILDAAREREIAVQREALEKSPPSTPPARAW